MKTLDIYLDFCFLQFFLEGEPKNRYSNEYQNWLDFLKFLQNHEHIKVITPNRSKELKKHSFVKKLHQLLENRAYRQEFFENLPKQTDKYKVSSKFAYETEIQNPHSVFFIEFSKEECTELEKKYGYFFINSENFASKWKLLNPRNYQSFKTVSKQGDFQKWTDFSKIKHPANSILIVDRYIFGGDYQHNLKEMFENLFEKVFLTNIFLIFGNKIRDKVSNLKDETDLKKNLKKIIKNAFPNNAYSLVQLFNNSNNKREEISLTHDRRIITNYFYLDSGDSYSYENKGEINTNTDFHIYTVFDSETFMKIQERLTEFKKLIFKVDGLPKIHFDNYEGNLQNRLLS